MAEMRLVRTGVRRILDIAVDPGDHYPLCERRWHATLAAGSVGAGVSAKVLKDNLAYLRNRVNLGCGDADIESAFDSDQLYEHIRLLEVARQLLKEFTKNGAPGIEILGKLPKKDVAGINRRISEMARLLGRASRSMSSARKDLKKGKSVDIERLLKEQVAARLAKVQQLIEETIDNLEELQDKIEALWKDSVSGIREDPVCVKNQKSSRGHRTGRVAK